MQDKLSEILPDAQVQELDAGQISPRAEIVLHMELEGDYAEKTAGRIDQICGHAIFPKIVMIICVSGWRKEVLIRAWNCKKMPGKSAGNCIITVTSQKKNKT